MPNWCGMWSQCGNISSMVFISLNMPAMLAGNTYQQSLSGGQESRNLSTFDAGATTEKHTTDLLDSLCRTASVGQDWIYIYSQVLTTGSLIASALYIVIPGSSLTRRKISLLFTFMLRRRGHFSWRTSVPVQVIHPLLGGKPYRCVLLIYQECQVVGPQDTSMLLKYLIQPLPLGAAEGQNFLRRTKKKRMHAKHLCIGGFFMYWLYSPLDSAHPVKVWLFLDRTRISQGILSKAGTGHSVKLV